MEENKKKI